MQKGHWEQPMMMQKGHWEQPMMMQEGHWEQPMMMQKGHWAHQHVPVPQTPSYVPVPQTPSYVPIVPVPQVAMGENPGIARAPQTPARPRIVSLCPPHVENGPGVALVTPSNKLKVLPHTIRVGHAQYARPLQQVVLIDDTRMPQDEIMKLEAMLIQIQSDFDSNYRMWNLPPCECKLEVKTCRLRTDPQPFNNDEAPWKNNSKWVQICQDVLSTFHQIREVRAPVIRISTCDNYSLILARASQLGKTSSDTLGSKRNAAISLVDDNYDYVANQDDDDFFSRSRLYIQTKVLSEMTGEWANWFASRIVWKKCTGEAMLENGLGGHMTLCMGKIRVNGVDLFPRYSDANLSEDDNMIRVHSACSCSSTFPHIIVQPNAHIYVIHESSIWANGDAGHAGASRWMHCVQPLALDELAEVVDSQNVYSGHAFRRACLSDGNSTFAERLAHLATFPPPLCVSKFANWRPQRDVTIKNRYYNRWLTMNARGDVFTRTDEKHNIWTAFHYEGSSNSFMFQHKVTKLFLYAGKGDGGDNIGGEAQCTEAGIWRLLPCCGFSYYKLENAFSHRTLYEVNGTPMAARKQTRPFERGYPKEQTGADSIWYIT